jgi:glycosyltransferase involved in cell wall biosynthesis
MHILLTPSSYPSKEHPVRGIFFREQAQALKKAGYKVGVITPQPKSLKLFPKTIFTKQGKIIQEDDRGIATYRQYSGHWSKFPYGNDLYWLKIGKNLFKKYIDAHGKPDIIHAHCALLGGVLAAEIKEKYDIPFVITEHSSAYARKLISSREIHLVKKAFISANARIFVSPHLGKLLESSLGEFICPWTWIPNLTNNLFQPNHTNLKNKKNLLFRFLNIALMTENKGQADLLYAFAQQFKDNNQIQLRLGGDGNILESLKSLAKELGIIKQVVFLGLLNRKQVLEEMQNADVFVLSSHYETFGVVLIEALACGKPIIATSCGGPECIVNKNNGLLVPPKNPIKLGEAMAKLLNTIDNYNQNLIYKDCMSRFEDKAVIEKISNIYKKILI